MLHPYFVEYVELCDGSHSSGAFSQTEVDYLVEVAERGEIRILSVECEGADEF